MITLAFFTKVACYGRIAKMHGRAENELTTEKENGSVYRQEKMLPWLHCS